MKLLTTIDHTSQSQIFDYAVVDQNHESIGTLSGMWNNEQSGELEFLGVKTGWLFGSNHVVPAAQAQVDDGTRTVVVPYLLAKIKDAPAFDADAEIKDEEEAQIYRYYGLGSAPAMASHRSEVATTGVANKSALGAAQATTGEVKTGSQIEVPLSEEEVKIGKRTVAAGSVRLRKVVRTEIVNQPVEVSHEEVVVERVSASDVKAGTGQADFAEKVIDVPLTREEVVVAKEAHVTGAVRLNKTSESQTEQVSETVRKEDVEVLRDGKTEVARDAR